MQREYTREQYLERIGWIRAARRPISITTDIIIGFPGETDADFEQTVTLLEEVGYDSIFSFQYSPRPNTASLAMEDAISEEEKGKRLRILQERQRQIQLERYQALVGTEQEALVEGRSGREGKGGNGAGPNGGSAQWKGRTTQNMVLNFTVPSDQHAQIQPGAYWMVRVSHAGPNSLIGEAIDGPLFSPSPLAARQPPVSASPFRIL
jgi:tRNA-2-methylthio-N6-dimethylallyladenosine synthase